MAVLENLTRLQGLLNVFGPMTSSLIIIFLNTGSVLLFFSVTGVGSWGASLTAPSEILILLRSHLFILFFFLFFSIFIPPVRLVSDLNKYKKIKEYKKNQKRI